jgi:hypothetical protein
MPIEIVGDTAPIHLVGESHVLSYAGLLARDVDSGRIFAPNLKCLIDLKAARYSDPQTGRLHQSLMDALQEMSLAGKADAGGLAPQAPKDTFLALFAGDIDIHGDLFTQMDQDYDVDLPGPSPYPPSAAGRSIIPFALLEMRLKEIFAPFFAAIRTFRSIGINRIILHALPPRSPDDERARRWCDGRLVSAVLRAKITWAANALIADFAAAEEFCFVSSWDALAPEGYLLPCYDLDGVHVTREAAAISYLRIVDAAIRT